MPLLPRIVPASDESLLVRFGSDPDAQRCVVDFTATMQTARDAFVRNVQPAYGSVLVVFDPNQIATDALTKVLLQRAMAAPVPVTSATSHEIDIPVHYGGEFGPDLEDVGARHDLGSDAVIELHTEPQYTVAFLGFAPGFPYLDGLSPQLATPRLDRPRTRVAAGSVGIGGEQTGVYPVAAPGGWRLIGRTPRRLFRPDESRLTLVGMGDRVRFRRITRREFDALERDEARGERRSPVAPAIGAGIRVDKPGLQTTIQDPGRFGFAHLGISAAGAADALALRLGNRLAGNPDAAAGIEMTLVGATLIFECAAVIVLAGAVFDARCDGVAMPWWEPVAVRAGARLEVGAARSGARCVLCVQGGIAVDKFLGSATTHVMTGIGEMEGRALVAGDRLPIAAASAPPQSVRLDRAWIETLYSPADPIRVTPAPQSDLFSPAAHAQFTAAAWRVREQSNRVGVRLEGPPLASPDAAGGLRTEGAALGAIQVPPDGQPIVLFVDHRTTGGYAKIANVAAVDMHRVGQLRPRDALRFVAIEFDAAHRLARQREAEIEVYCRRP